MCDSLRIAKDLEYLGAPGGKVCNLQQAVNKCRRGRAQQEPHVYHAYGILTFPGALDDRGESHVFNSTVVFLSYYWELQDRLYQSAKAFHYLYGGADTVFWDEFPLCEYMEEAPSLQEVTWDDFANEVF